MVFVFLVPSIPVVLGNFLVPIMIGAKGQYGLDPFHAAQYRLPAYKRGYDDSGSAHRRLLTIFTGFNL